ncbi:MAG: hypothetical protein Q9217_001780 [Psora testacea]
MPYPFSRPLSTDLQHLYDLRSTSINDESFALISTFLVFDRERGMDILGSKPTYDVMFKDVPEQNKIYICKDPQQKYSPQQVVDLNTEPPTFNATYLPNPPVYAAAGGAYHQALVYAGTCEATEDASLVGESRGGLKMIDPKNDTSWTILNNNIGIKVGCVDNLVVHTNTGQTFFTHNDYAWAAGALFAIGLPELPVRVYRFVPLTGAVNIVDNTLKQPNGMALLPNECSDTAAVGARTKDKRSLSRRTLSAANGFVMVTGGSRVTVFDAKDTRSANPN